MSDFFILGCSRSGTTMFASMLNSHQEVIVPPETTWLGVAYEMQLSRMAGKSLTREFLFRINRNLSRHGHTMWKVFMEAFMRDHVAFRGSYAELLNCFAADAKSYFSASYFGEKTPAHTTYIHELYESFPEYRKVILLRDPRDIVCSYFNAWYEKNDESLYKILLNLKCYLLNITAAIREYDCLTLTYEDLTTSPEEELRRVCRYLSIPYSDSMLSLNPTSVPSGVHSNLNKEVFKNSQKYLDELSGNYISAIEHVLRDEMELLGYEPDSSTCGDKAFIAGYMTIPDTAASQVAHKASVLKNRENWRPSFKTRGKSFIRGIGSSY